MFVCLHYALLISRAFLADITITAWVDCLMESLRLIFQRMSFEFQEHIVIPHCFII